MVGNFEMQEIGDLEILRYCKANKKDHNGPQLDKHKSAVQYTSQES